MKVRIKRNSKTFLFLLIISIFGIIFGIMETTKSLENLYFSLASLGILFLAFSLSETGKKLSEVLLICGFLSYSIAFFWASFFYLKEGGIVVSFFLAFLGLFIFGMVIVNMIIMIIRSGYWHKDCV
jgi:apolipoprotein N-acyltransferase